MNRLGSTAMLVAVFLVSIAYQLPALFQPLVLYDEGLVLCGADRVLRGDVPYRDFWSIYGPGQFYALALLFGAFGKSVLVERIHDLIVRCLVSLIVFLILRDTVRLRLALAGWAISVVWIQFFGSPGYPVYPFLLLFLAGVFFLYRHLSGDDRISAPTAGAAIGLAIVFRQFLGAAAGLLMLVSIYAFFSTRRSQGPQQLHLSRPPKGISGRFPASFLLFAMLPGLVVLAALGFAGGLPDMIDQLLIFPLTTFADYRSLPYPSLHLLLPQAIDSWSSLAGHLRLAAEVLNFYLFPLLCVVGLMVHVAVVIRTRQLSPISCVALYLCVIGLLFLKQGSVRSETLHLLPCGVAAILVSFISYHQSRLAIRNRLWVKVASTCVALYLMYPVSLWCKTLSETRFHAVAPVSESYRRAVDFVKARTRDDDRIFIGVYNHDRIVANSVTLYFLSGRGYGTKYHELHPGVITTRRIQQEVIDELERNDVEYLLLTNGWWSEPNQSRIDSGVDSLDAFIRSRFESVMASPNISVWARADRNVSRKRQ